jgi:uncharacterized protein
MSWLLSVIAQVGTRSPAAVIVGLITVTAAMGALATRGDIEVDLVELGSEDSQSVRAMERIRSEFGDPTAAVQVIVDGGPGGDILTSEGLAAVESAVEATIEALGPAVDRDPDGTAVIVSLPTALDESSSVGGPLLAVEDGEVEVGDLLATDPRLAGLVSDDFEAGTGRARATALVAQLDPALDGEQRTAAAQRVRAALGDDRGRSEPVSYTVVSADLFVDGLREAVRDEVPLLFAVALLGVLGILAFFYRSPFDVAIGFLGLVATVVWTFGAAAVVGPAGLGWTGPLTQFAVVIPVLLVGLGIDYSVHLTARYRELRVAGARPQVSAERTVRTVGVALALATLATAVGFASIVIAPLRMLADFGVFVALGVVCAFLVMSLLVPAARVLRDRRREDVGAEAVRELRADRLMGPPRRLALGSPHAGLAVGAVLLVVGVLSASQLPVEFDRDAFIPEGSEVEAVLAHQRELFGGGLTETTFVLVDGDVTDPAVANAMLEAHERLDDVGAVRTVGGGPQAISVVAWVEELASAADAAERSADGEMTGAASPGGAGSPDGTPAGAARAALSAAWESGRFVADAPLADVYEHLRETLGPAQVDRLLGADGRSALVRVRTTAGDAGARQVQEEIESAFDPVRAAGGSVTVTSEPIVLAETSEALGRFQAQAIGLTLAVVTVILTLYYAATARRWHLGPIAMIPAVFSASLVVVVMWVLGISFNVVTATLTAIAVGIGVPYGVHVVNRFGEDLERAPLAEAIGSTLRGTGSALAGSALTTLAAFLVLVFSALPPMRSLGLLGATAIAGALLAGLLIEPGACVAWARRQASPPP